MDLMRAFALFAFATPAFAQAPALHSGSNVYIEPMAGLETYLSAAFIKRHVPLVIVADKDKADFIIRGTVHQSVPSTPQVVVNNSATATINEGDNRNQAWNQGWASGQAAAAARAARRASLGSTSVSISIVDVKSSQIVFGTSAGKGGTTNQESKTAEDCAKQLKEFIDKSDKPKK
jgi:hypothetical protein